MSVDRNSVRGLLQAAEKGDLQKLENYLKHINVNAVNEQSETALHFAAANGQQNAVRLLITKGAALECENWCGWTPLMYAAYYGHTNVATYLIENKAQVNVCNRRLMTPLICAARCGHKAVIEILLENGAQIDPKKFVVPPTNQEMKAFEHLDIQEPATQLERRPPMTALMAAAQHGHISVVSLLMQYGTPVDYQNDVTKYTALMLAATNGHLNIVKLLIQTGAADANLVNCRNQTAYMLSIMAKRNDIEAYLSVRTQKRILELPREFPPLIIAAKTGNLQEVERIFRTTAGVDVNVLSNDGVTPLLYASLNNHIDVVKYLLKKGAKTDIQDKFHGWTALMHATIKRNVDVVKLLLRAGADTNLKSNRDLTVFDLATLAGSPQITRLLAPLALGGHGKSTSSEKELKNGKGILSKMGSRIRRGQNLNRIPVHDIGLTSMDDADTTTHNTELRKTSSIISVLDANKQAIGSVRPKLSLGAPIFNLPDEVVAPVLPPCPSLKSFDLPKMPYMGTKATNSLSNSSENNSYILNNSNESSSLKAILDRPPSIPSGLKRPQMPTNAIAYTHDQYSPQSSLTTSEFTSVSQNRGPARMPTTFNSFNNRPSSNLSQPMFPPQWQPQPMDQAFTPGFKSPPSSQPRAGAKSPYTLNDISLRSMSSGPINDKDGDINSLLKNLEMETYISQFTKEEVGMEILCEMDDDDLKDLGIKETIYRRRLMDAVNTKNKGRTLQNSPMNAMYSPTPPGKPPSLIPAGYGQRHLKGNFPIS